MNKRNKGKLFKILSILLFIFLIPIFLESESILILLVWSFCLLLFIVGERFEQDHHEHKWVYEYEDRIITIPIRRTCKECEVVQDINWNLPYVVDEIEEILK